MQESCLADRFGELVPLSDGERRALASLEERERTLRRGTALLREKDRNGEMFLLKRGMTMGYVLLDDGSRQILCFNFPGDLLGMSALAYRSSPETIVALGDCTVCPIDRATYARVTSEHPRLGTIIMAVTQEEMGDATGLTAVHVNRMLRQLEEEGLIARDNGRVTLLREADLAAAANYVNRYAGLDLSWLPPAP